MISPPSRGRGAATTHLTTRRSRRVSQPVDRRRHAIVPRRVIRAPFAKPSVSTRRPRRAERSSTRPRRRRIREHGDARACGGEILHALDDRRAEDSVGREAPGSRAPCRGEWGRRPRDRVPRAGRTATRGSTRVFAPPLLVRVERSTRGGLVQGCHHDQQNIDALRAKKKATDIVRSRVKTRSVASLGVCRLGRRREGRGSRAQSEREGRGSRA